MAERTLHRSWPAIRHGIIGVIEVVNRRGAGRFADEDLAFLDALAGSVAVAIENARLYEQVKASEEKLRTEVGVLRRDLARRDRFTEIVGTGPAMSEVFRLMESAAASPIAVLIEGETGTGKELVAQMPASMQAKLLRVLEQGEVIPVGDTRPRRVDVRIVSATNRDLRAEVAERRFREDLYYRLSAFPIQLPPLRARREDVPLLAQSFVAAAAERHGKRVAGIDPAALDRLLRFD